MGVIRRLLTVEHDLWDRIKHADLKSMPRLQRLLHFKTRRHIFGVLLGTAVMLVGSTMAVNGHEQVYLPHYLWDALAYFIHATGTLPVMRHIEPIWAALAD